MKTHFLLFLGFVYGASFALGQGNPQTKTTPPAAVAAPLAPQARAALASEYKRVEKELTDERCTAQARGQKADPKTRNQLMADLIASQKARVLEQRTRAAQLFEAEKLAEVEASKMAKKNVDPIAR